MARDYDKEYRDYQGTEEQKKRRAQRNKARREAIREGKVSKGDNKEIDHVAKNRKGPLGSKTQVLTKAQNRAKQPKRNGSQD
jgi:hypothetical protein